MIFIPPGLLMLAQRQEDLAAEKQRDAVWTLLVLFAALLAAVIIAGIVVYIIRSRSLDSDTSKSGVPLTLADVRRMHGSGEIDDDEMTRLKKIVTDRTRKKLAEPSNEKEE